MVPTTIINILQHIENEKDWGNFWKENKRKAEANKILIQLWIILKK